MDVPIGGYPNNLRAQKVTILNGTAVSEMIATQGDALVAIEMPGTWTAANIGIQACLSGNASKLKNVYDNAGNLQQSQAAASEFIVFPWNNAIFGPFIALTSVAAGTTTPANQGQDTELVLLFRRFLS